MPFFFLASGVASASIVDVTLLTSA
jgi:hypothetical protein